MKNVLLALAISYGACAFGHGGHGHHNHEPVTKAQASELAVATVADLVTQNKVEEAFKSKKPTLEKKQFGPETHWVATFVNPSAKDKAKKNLYVFLSLDGEVLAANHTGK